MALEREDIHLNIVLGFILSTCLLRQIVLFSHWLYGKNF